MTQKDNWEQKYWECVGNSKNITEEDRKIGSKTDLLLEEILGFIQEQIPLAKEEERKRVVEEINNMEIETVGNSAATVDQIIKLIKKID